MLGNVGFAPLARPNLGASNNLGKVAPEVQSSAVSGTSGPAKPSAESPAAPPTVVQQKKLNGAAGILSVVTTAASKGIDNASKGIDKLIDTGSTKNCSPEVRAVLKTATKILAVILSAVAVVLSPVVGPIVGIVYKGVEAVKTAIKGENHKTDKEIKSVLKDDHITYPKELTKKNPAGEDGIISEFTSTLVNREPGDDGRIACDKGRITPQMDIAQHNGDAYGTATISSMMTDSIMTSAAKDPEMSGKIDGFINSGIDSFRTLGVADDVKVWLQSDASDQEKAALDKLFGGGIHFSDATANMTAIDKSDFYNKITTMSRGLQSVDDVKKQGHTIILRGGLLNGNKASSAVDKNEAKMIEDELKFAQFMDKIGNEKLGVTYSYRSTNVQMGHTAIDSKTQEATEVEIKSMKNVLDVAIPGGEKGDPNYDAATSALDGLKGNPAPTAETRLQLLFQFDRAIVKATTDDDGQCKTAKVIHCKSGKDRTGSVAQWTSVTNKTLDKMEEAAKAIDGKEISLFSMAEAKAHFEAPSLLIKEMSNSSKNPQENAADQIKHIAAHNFDVLEETAKELGTTEVTNFLKLINQNGTSLTASDLEPFQNNDANTNFDSFEENKSLNLIPKERVEFKKIMNTLGLENGTLSKVDLDVLKEIGDRLLTKGQGALSNRSDLMEKVLFKLEAKSNAIMDTFNKLETKMDNDLYEGNKFNAKEHCSRVMEKPEGEGKAKLGEMDTGVQGTVMGKKAVANLAAESKTFTGSPFAGLVSAAKADIRAANQ